MEWNQETLQFLSPSPAPRRQPESSLADAANRPGYALAVLRLVAEPSVDEKIRQAAAVNFKNHLCARWASTPTPHDAAVDADVAPAASSAPIPDAEKEQIRALIVPLMLSSSARIQTTHGAIPAVGGRGAGSRPWFRRAGLQLRFRGKLGLECVDLYLIHFPARLKEGTEGSYLNGKMLPFDMKGTWEATEECSKLGLAKSIGVSNFGTKKLSQLLMHATIPPAVNQVEMNVAWQQEKLREYCRDKGIHVSAWSPLAAHGAPWGSLAVMESPLLTEIAVAKGIKTVAQVALRWIYEQGSSIIVKSFNKERMRKSLQILGWELSQEDLERMKLQIPQRRGFAGEIFVSEDGPYKSVDELWDEDA
ncbi:hypothetical protein NL676_021988 [Syzygium grande]|nr:hypothetical protein NL676_021988 [Syzygium grande]